MTLRELFIALGFKVDEKSEKAAEKQITGLKNFAIKALGVISIGFSLIGIKTLAEEFGGVNEQIKNATKGLGDLEDHQKKILEAANNARVSYADMAKSVTKLVENSDGLFENLDEAAKFSELTTKAFKSSNLAVAEVNTLQDALNKSFASGKVEAQTMTQIIEKSPAAANLLAKSLGVARSELTNLASKGKISLNQLKDAFLNSADEINRDFDNLSYGISDALLNIRNQWGLWLAEMDDTFKVSEKIGTSLVKGFTKIMDFLRRGRNLLERFADRLGGVDNLLKLLAVSAAAIFVALNGSKILNLLGGIGKAISAINLKMLLIVAVIVAVFLIVDDFINFMKGNDSVIGSLLEKAGINSEEVRDRIISAWNQVKDFLIAAWGFIRSAAQKIWNGLKDFWAKNGEGIKDSLLSIWNNIMTLLSTLWDSISTVAQAVFGALKAFWDKWGDKVMAQFSLFFAFVGDLFNAFLLTLTGLIEFITGVFTGDWEKAWNGIKKMFEGIWNAIKAFFEYIWDSIYNWFGDKIDAIIEKVVNFVNKVKELLGGVKEFFGGIADDVGDFVSNATAKVGDFLGGSSDNNVVNTVVGGGSKTTIINMNNDIDNTFNGDDRTAQTQGAQAMGKAGEDMTEDIARALAMG